MVANIGSPERLSYLLVGDTVNLASRLQTLTKNIGCEILLSKATFEHLSGADIGSAGVEPVPTVSIKGNACRWPAVKSSDSLLLVSYLLIQFYNTNGSIYTGC